MHVSMADSSITINNHRCYISDPCNNNHAFASYFSMSDGLNHCCGTGNVGLNTHYSAAGVVDCGACELFKYVTTTFIF